MKITLEPTDDFFLVDGHRCRAWSGSDDAGMPVVAMIACIELETDDEAARRRFGDELDRLQPASALDFLLPDLRRRHDP